MLVLFAPVLSGIALAVALALGRPVLFRQVRAGRDGVPFTVLKFRSMRDAAPGLPSDDAARITPFGRRFRASGLDELPQLLNVLRGEMSLIGPRPLLLDYTARYSPRQALRLRVRPGLAGAAQAMGRNAPPWPVRLEADAAYAATPPTLAGDARALLGSLRVLLSGRGATAPGHATTPPFEGE
ncbi:sugar transferase [Humitalea sp. 24SJ18S-53]|uniref:sugar transferase n=1 Tax=Humitalea sp. 24SJ18S-53 TaxID=3422307 RepID=UPI003D674D36